MPSRIYIPQSGIIGIRGTVFSFIAETKKKMIPRRHGYSLQGIAKFDVRTVRVASVLKASAFYVDYFIFSNPVDFVVTTRAQIEDDVFASRKEHHCRWIVHFNFWKDFRICFRFLVALVRFGIFLNRRSPASTYIASKICYFDDVNAIFCKSTQYFVHLHVRGIVVMYDQNTKTLKVA
ncbi:unnamed protein product [Albugo candida]|uniref:Uncharacterized protein n=1 Tax=Albugo candida TaxID=65357 RepID=A0A024GSW1_9STRA|nr:unnamed protein product [Albugo candida]|eukprot:CCI50009.1 unnamed protein product [Albugo candida]